MDGGVSEREGTIVSKKKKKERNWSYFRMEYAGKEQWSSGLTCAGSIRFAVHYACSFRRSAHFQKTVCGVAFQACNMCIIRRTESMEIHVTSSSSFHIHISPILWYRGRVG